MEGSEWIVSRSKAPIVFFLSSNRFRVTSLNHAGISFRIYRTSPSIEIDFYSTLGGASSFDSLLAALNLACKGSRGQISRHSGQMRFIAVNVTCCRESASSWYAHLIFWLIFRRSQWLVTKTWKGEMISWISWRWCGRKVSLQRRLIWGQSSGDTGENRTNAIHCSKCHLL